MDNLSHSLGGLLIGETAAELSQSSRKKRLLLLASSFLAANFPDLDLLYTWINPKPLGYLLQHRGHTHTLLGLLPQLLLVFLLLLVIPSFRELLRDRKTRLLVLAVSSVNLLLHLVMDSWNSYGVHPFWPISSRWYYGDMVFILEPMVWFSFALPLFFTVRNKIFRGILAFIMASIPLIAWYKGLLAWYSIAGLGLMALLSSGILRFLRGKILRLGFGFLALLIFIGVEFASSRRVKQLVAERWAAEENHRPIRDIIADPLPANPICWRTIQIDLDETAGVYRTTIQPISLLPQLIPAEDCPMFRSSTGTIEQNLLPLRDAVTKDCYFRSWLRFARAPLLKDDSAFDIRFGGAGPENFTYLDQVGSSRPCMRWEAAWDWPRRDLFPNEKSPGT